MMQNFGNTIRDVSPKYREELEAAVTGHLLGTFQNIRLMDQQGAFARIKEPLTDPERGDLEDGG